MTWTQTLLLTTYYIVDDSRFILGSRGGVWLERHGQRLWICPVDPRVALGIEGRRVNAEALGLSTVPKHHFAKSYVLPRDDLAVADINRAQLGSVPRGCSLPASRPERGRRNTPARASLTPVRRAQPTPLSGPDHNESFEPSPQSGRTQTRNTGKRTGPPQRDRKEVGVPVSPQRNEPQYRGASPARYDGWKSAEWHC